MVEEQDGEITFLPTFTLKKNTSTYGTTLAEDF